MVFYSNNFTFNGRDSTEYGVHLVTQDDDVLNDYGIPFSINEEDSEIEMSFCYADEIGMPLEWEEEVLEDILSWLITDTFKPFISEDNENIIYFLKGKGYKKRFTHDFKGIVDVTFKAIAPCGFKQFSKKVAKGQKQFSIVNLSNVDDKFKPLIELKNIEGGSITISNTSTGKPSFTLNNIPANKDIFIDNKIGNIVDEDGNILIRNSNRKWIELKKGVNKFAIEGNCDLVFKAYYPVVV